MKPFLWVFTILMVHQTICAPQKLDDSDKRIENDDENTRLKRASRNGQTQSQYLNFGDSQTEGKADAEITKYGSRASVSGSNGMGQAQSQSSGSGCDECHGSEGSYSNGAAHGPDPLRSLSGGGIPQSHASSQSPSGYDAYGRPYSPNKLPSSGYSNEGFGPSATRGPSNFRDLQTFGTGFPSTGDDHPQNGVLSVTPAPIAVSTNPAGNFYQTNRGQPSNVGGSTFLNRPISNGKAQTTGSGNDQTTRSSILPGKKTTPNDLDNNKLVDRNVASGSPSSFGMTSRPSSSNYGNTGSNFPDSSLPSQKMQPNRGSFESRMGTGGQPSPYGTSSGTPSGNAFDRSKPSSVPGSGSYDRTFNKPSVKDGDRSKATDSISHPSNLPSVSQTPSQSSILKPSIQPGGSVFTDGSRIQSPTDHGTESTGTAISQPESDSLSNFRNIFRLPPGLCLVQCDTLKSDQNRLTPEQIRDAFIASGLIDQRGGLSQGTAVSSVPTGSQSSQNIPQYQQPISVGSQPSQGMPQYQQPGGPGIYPSQGLPQYQQPISVGSQPSQGMPQYQQPISVGSQPLQGQPQYQQPGGPGTYPSQGLPQYQKPISVGSQPSQGMPQYQQPGGPGTYPSQGLPQYQQPISVGSQPLQGQPQYQQPGGPGTYPSQGQPQYQQPSGSGSQPSQGLPQYQQPSGSGSQPSQGLPQYQQPIGPGSYPIQGLPQFQQQFQQQYQQQSGTGSQPSQQLPQYQQLSGVHIPQGSSSSQAGLPTQTIPSASQFIPGLTVSSPSNGQLLNQPGQVIPPGSYSQYQQPIGSAQGVPQYQQLSGVHIPQGSLFPQAGLPTQTIPSANQFIPGSTIPTSNNGQLTNQPGQILPSGLYQGSVPSLGYPSIATIPQGQIHQLPTPTQYTQTGQPNQPGSLSQTTSGQYPIGTSQSAGQVTQTGAGRILPSGVQKPQGILSGSTTQGLFPGQVASPGYIIPSSSGIYSLPGGVQLPGTLNQIPSVAGGVYPHVEKYPGAYSQQGGPYGTPTDGSYSGIGQSSSSVPPAGNLVYGGGDGSSGSGQTGNVGVGSESDSSSGVVPDEDGHSQAESSIKNGEVVASAQGTKNGGTAQTQVQGTYNGSGSFSASAQTADKDRSAQAQVSGNKDGALSSSQGSGGKSQAQSQVKVDEKTGGTSASGQSSGAKHSSQSEVVANEKGGLADAQSSGPGQTSSQAQIGFRPEGANINPSENIFNGGGQASAQSGVHSGQSQSQIQGSFKYGISYHGAAQAASGTKEQVSTYRENSKKLFQSIGQFSRSNRGAVTQAPPSDIANINEIGLRPLPKATAVAPDTIPDESGGLDDEDYNEMNDEGEDEYNDSPNLSKEIKTKTSRVEIELPKRIESSTNTKRPEEIETITAKIENKIDDNAKLIRMPAVRSETVPDGFKGKIGETRQRTLKNQIDFDKKIDVKPNTYVTVTKSVSGSLDNSKAATDDDKKFESTYYTKTSTCGYFTFSCNIVYGSNGRSKICRPKAPENGKC